MVLMKLAGMVVHVRAVAPAKIQAGGQTLNPRANRMGVSNDNPAKFNRAATPAVTTSIAGTLHGPELHAVRVVDVVKATVKGCWPTACKEGCCSQKDVVTMAGIARNPP
jgi:hypothetical protein